MHKLPPLYDKNQYIKSNYISCFLKTQIFDFELFLNSLKKKTLQKTQTKKYIMNLQQIKNQYRKKQIFKLKNKMEIQKQHRLQKQNFNPQTNPDQQKKENFNMKIDAQKNQQHRFYPNQQLCLKYDVSQKCGFLQDYNCSQVPLKFLFFTEAYQFLIMKDRSQSFGSIVDKLPLYCTQKHSLDQLPQKQKKFMFALLACSLHTYVWENGQDKPRKSVPQIIGIPLLKISEYFGIFPSVSYAAILLYNWFPKTKTQSMNPDDLRIMFNMSGTQSEAWFYLITISIEGLGGKYLTEIFNAHLLNEIKMTSLLKNLKKCLIQMKMVMKRMHEHNDPKVFYHVIRKFFTGMNHQNIGPDGILIEGTQHRIKGHGGSGSQSTLIQVLNTFFQVKLQGKSGEYLKKMFEYMPAKHVKFLYDLQKKPKINQIIRGWRNQDLLSLYNECIQAFTQFRQAHFGLIHAYVFAFSTKNADQEVGTGGTDLQPFLKSVIHVTQKAKIEMIEDKNSSSQNEIKTISKEQKIKRKENDVSQVKHKIRLVNTRQLLSKGNMLSYGKKEILLTSLGLLLVCLCIAAIYRFTAD